MLKCCGVVFFSYRTFIYDEQQTFMCSRGAFIMARLRDDEKLKTFVFKKTLAYELELFAKTKHVSEASLVRRYVEEGMRRDKGQTTLDE